MAPFIAVQQEDVDIGALVRAAKVPGTGAVLFDGIVRDDTSTGWTSSGTSHSRAMAGIAGTARRGSASRSRSSTVSGRSRSAGT
jgi:molybdopterin synthase catalytic subunit